MNYGSSLATSPMAVLPEDKIRVVSYGIPLFELQKTKRQFINPIDAGYFDVRVNEGIQEYTMTYSYTPVWYKGRRSYIEYHHDRKGICTGYCPDDPDWHNRIMLASNINSGLFKIMRYHTRAGFVAEERITQEILYLRDLTHRWRFEDDGQVIEYYEDEEECRKAAKIYDQGTKGVVHVKWGRIPEIRQLILKYKSAWSIHPEFQNGILADIKRKVEKKFSKDETQTKGINLEEQVVSILQNMDPEKIAEILNRAKDKPQSDTLEGAPIDQLHINKLRSLAKQRGLDAQPGNTKEELLEIIKEDIKLKKSINQNKKTTEPTTKPDSGGVEEVSFQ